MEWEGCVVSDFVKTMRDWRRMCDTFSKQYGAECRKYCPLNYLESCGAIWEVERGTYGKIAETVDAWAAENPEPQYPTWGEWFLSTRQVPTTAEGGNDFLKTLNSPIPANIAEKLGLKPKGGGNGV
jgi:hypothetical protein